MTVVLNHTIVPVGDKLRGAQLLADLLGLEVGAPAGPFVPVRINDQQINHHGGGRGVRVRDPDGTAYEFFTAIP